ncbi:MAG: hypothetical protein R2880_09005 [Deinococcales bacterium]
MAEQPEIRIFANYSAEGDTIKALNKILGLSDGQALSEKQLNDLDRLIAASLRQAFVMVEANYGYGAEPSDEVVRTIYDCWTESVLLGEEKTTIKGYCLSRSYEHLSFGNPRYVFIHEFADVSYASLYMRSDGYKDFKKMLTDNRYVILRSNIFAYKNGPVNPVVGP